MTKNTYRPLSLLTTLLLATSSSAEEYLLSFLKQCSSAGSQLQYECKKPDDLSHYIYNSDGPWKAKTADGVVQAAFKKLREDENILILEQETIYSGNQVLYIMKKSNQFYLVQAAYSDILEDNEITTKQGVYTKTVK